MNRVRLPLSSALLVGASTLAFTPALASECSEVCIPATPPQCVTNGARACGPLQDDSAVETGRIEPNLERQAGGLPEGTPPFRISVDGVPNLLATPQLQVDAVRQADLAAPQLVVAKTVAGKPARTLIQADSLHAQPVLSVVANADFGTPGTPVTFFGYANYASFIDFTEVLIWQADDGPDAAPYARVRVKPGVPAQWTPSDRDVGRFRYALRVYARTGRFDQTDRHELEITRAVPARRSPERTGPLFENQRALSDIAVKGAMVTVSGSDIPAGSRVELLGLSVPVSADGRFVAQQIVPAGTTTVRYQVIAPDGTRSTVERPVDLPKTDDFLVALADITAGHRSWDHAAAVEALAGERADQRTDYVDGRLAFYWRSKLGEGVRLTAAADTGEHPLSDLFSQFGRKDPRSLLRRLDPDRHYPVYGDDSVTVEDAPTFGRFYVRAQSDNGEALWGNFQTQLTGTDLIQYSRGLYGASLHWKSPALTRFGDERTELTAFAADPGTIGSREELASTGGSLYYLHRQDITQGSERVAVEVRDRDSGLVLERRELAPAADYDMNYLQGRLLLRNPAPITAQASQFVRDSSLTGNPVYVVVTYEYAPGLTAPATMTVGGRGSQWLGDHLRIGTTAYRQGEDQEHQTLLGGDVLLRYKPGTFVRAELAHSQGSGSPTAISGSGGYDFSQISAAGGSAGAFAVEAATDLAEISGGRGRIASYWRKREAGFSSPGALTGTQAQEQFGAKVDVALDDRTSLIGKADFADSRAAGSHTLEAGLTRSLGKSWFARVGVRADSRSGPAPALSQSLLATPLQTPLTGPYSRTDGAVTLGYRSPGHVDAPGTPGAAAERDAEGRLRRSLADHQDLTDPHPWSAYLFGQTTLDSSGASRSNDRTGIGGDVQLNRRTRLRAEGSDGASGLGASLGADYAVNDRGSLALNYALTAENPDGYNTGRLGRLSATSRYRFDDAVSVFAEGRYDHGRGPVGLTQAYGVDFAASQAVRVGLRYDHGALRDAAVGEIRRSAVGLTFDYSEHATHFSSALEYRTDASATGRRQTWAARNSLSYKPGDDWRLFGKANFAFADGDAASTLTANYYELVAAAAYRPVRNDRLNLLAKFTYLYDLASAGQINGTGITADFAQRSKVFAIDGTYQLTPLLAVGAKYAIRTGQLRSTTEANAPWFSSTAQFVAVRADLRVVKEWDALIEARRLSVSETHDARVGALAAVYRHLGDHVKVGVGYNFTDYSDELTNLSYRERGMFFNLVGKF